MGEHETKAITVFANKITTLHGRLSPSNITSSFCFFFLTSRFQEDKTMWGRKGMWHMKCCMPNPPHGQGLHLQQKKRTLKHKSNKSGDQSFFYVQLSCSVPAASWATQAQSLISMWSLTWTRHHAVNMKGYANTQALSLSLSHTHALIHNALVLLCLSLMYAPFCPKKRARNTKTNNPHAAAPSHSALLLCSKNSIHLNNGEEEKCQH